MDAPTREHPPIPDSPAGPPPVLRAVARWSAVLPLVAGLVAATVVVAALLRSAVVPLLLAALTTALLEPADRFLRRVGLAPGVPRRQELVGR